MSTEFATGLEIDTGPAGEIGDTANRGIVFFKSGQ